MHLLVERGRRGDVVPEGLLHHDARRCRHAGIREPLDHRAEQGRRDLEVEDGAARFADGLGHTPIGVVVAEVTGQIRQPRGEAIEHFVIDRLTAVRDALACVCPQVVDGPVVGCDSQDRAVQQAAPLQPVERVEGHDLGEVTADAEDDEHVRGLRSARFARS